MILIVVMVAVAALSLGALAFSSLMVGEREVAHVVGRQVQAVMLAESGIEVARRMLEEQPNAQSPEAAWYDDTDHYRGVLIVDDETPQGRGRFAIVAPGMAERYGQIRFGLVCESAKLNLNSLLSEGGDSGDARDRLLALPEMTEEIADCILDWLDSDDEPREFGVEADYYESLDPPYRPANGPMCCLEELLFVRGVTSWHLHGADRNRNGFSNSDEAVPGTLDPDGSMQCGWSAYLTLHSRENNNRPDGQPKIHLNQDDAETLYGELEEALGSEWATFIVGYRQQSEPYEGNGAGSSSSNDDSQENRTGDSSSGSSPRDAESGENRGRGESNDGDSGNPSGQGSDRSGTPSAAEEEEVEYQDHATGQLDLTQPMPQELESPLDLIGKRIKVKYQGSEKSVVVAPLFPGETEAMRDFLPKLMAYTATDAAKTIDGRINVNLAPLEVLACVPGIKAELAEEIMQQRPPEPTTLPEYQQNATWLLMDGLVSVDEMKQLLPYLTAGGCVYQVQAVGFFDQGGPVARIQAILDASASPPRVVSLKDLTPSGRGFDPAELGATP